MKRAVERLITWILILTMVVGFLPPMQLHVHAAEKQNATLEQGDSLKKQTGPVITKQPTDGKAKLGENYCITVEAQGEGLTYTWYGRDAGASEWFKSSVADNTYDDVMTSQRAGREVYCVITDKNGNAVTTDMVKLVLQPTYIWEQWTQPVTMTASTYPTYGGSSTGYYTKGQTFGGILYSSTAREGRDVLWNLNHSTYYSAVANPASLLYTTDYRGRVFNESAWAGSVCSTTALKACGYSYPYSTAEISTSPDFTEKNDHSINNLAFGDLLWVQGHVAGIIGVTAGADGKVASVKIIEQAGVLKVFEIAAANWDNYFAQHWTKIFRGSFNEALTAPVEYPENYTIIFERGNNTYVTDTASMLFYIPAASTVYLTKNGVTTQYAKTAFPTRTVNQTTVFDLASLFTGVGDYYFHTDLDTTDICIKVIDGGKITISGKTATVSGYQNCKILGYRVIQILEDSKSSSFNFWEAPKGYTSEAVNLSFRWLSGNTFPIENIPQNTAGWKLEVYLDTGYGWARFLSDNVMTDGSVDSHQHKYNASVTAPTCTEKGYTTHTCACGDSYIDNYTDPRPLNILMIGNSFSWDAADFWYDMQESMTYSIMKSMVAAPYDVHLAVMYKGSATLAYHATCAMKNTGDYTFTEIGPETNYRWQPSSGKNNPQKILDHLKERDWDIIVVQSYQHEADGTEPRSTFTGGDSRFIEPSASLSYLLDYFHQHEPGADVYYYMPWATEKFYGKDGTTAGYEAIANHTADKIPNISGTNSGKTLAGIIPVGTGIQNARTTYLDSLRYSTGTGSTALLKDPQNGLQYDSQHLSFGIGRYIAGAIVAECLIPQEIRAPQIRWPAVKDSPSVGMLPEEYTRIAQEAARSAVRNPYQITVLPGYETDLADRVCAKLEITDFTGTGIHNEAELRNHIDRIIAKQLSGTENAEIQVTVNNYSLENSKLMELDATLSVRIGYTTRQAQLMVVNGTNHRFNEWITVSIPTADSLGIEKRVCRICGFDESRSVEGSWQKYDLASHLQEIPCLHGNLWDMLKPESVMIDHNGNWVSAGSSVYSITIPVSPGDKIYANSFAEKGIQVSFIGTYGIVKTTFSSETLAEFKRNGGFLIAPEDAIAVNIPVWNVNAPDNTVRLLNYANTITETMKSPNCTEQGYTEFTCGCGYSYQTDWVQPTGHKWSAATCEKAKTCSVCKKTEGAALGHKWSAASCETAKTCSVCKKTEGSALGHKWSAATCDKAKTCSVCKKTEGSALGHKWVAATCDKAKTCSVCKKTEGAALGHKWTDATCETTKTCSVCKKTEGAALGHKWTDATCETAKTCSVCKKTEGSATGHKWTAATCDKAKTCSVCKKTEGSALGHKWNPATCDTAKTCSVCKKTEGSPKDHVWDKGTVIKSATETAEGVMTYKCTACGKTRTETIPMLSHTHKYEKQVTAPTCTEQGYTTYTCKCGHSYVDNYTKATGHKAVTDAAISATCTQNGLTSGSHCSVCGVVIKVQEVVPATGHSWDKGTVTKPATEEAEGIMTYKCTACGETKTASIPVLSHTHKYEKQVTAPTCTEQGYTTYTCKCGHSYVDNYTNATGHKAVADAAISATCTKTGLTDGSHCEVCGLVLKAQEIIPETGHSWDTGTVTKPATEEAEGVMTFQCTVCGDSRTESIPALEHVHKYEKETAAASCEKGGYDKFTCACGHGYTENEVEALGHKWVDATCEMPKTCERCGKTEGEAAHRFKDGLCVVCGATQIVAEGEYSDKIRWTLDANGVLTVTGTGELKLELKTIETEDPDAEPVFENAAPWADYADEIKKAVIEEGITELGDGAFLNCPNLEEVAIAASVKTIGQYAFADSEKLHLITFMGDAPVFGKNCFRHLAAYLVYPAENETWTEATLETTGGAITLTDEKPLNPALRPGDVTADGKADYSDALLILRASIGLEELTEEQQSVADVTGDNKFDYGDALLILRRSIGLE